MDTSSRQPDPMQSGRNDKATKRRLKEEGEEDKIDEGEEDTRDEEEGLMLGSLSSHGCEWPLT
ncbi:Hypothetical protein FKW44_020664 [Caligus rogercresseyi]|uniref:Uncharacterized protein n=1 Tax=Caligus rogercresseyi TaxID=217165 RepID=A0A7T8GQ98_CALRO|nr:Hypothetical protein FKW44_020664 [Caligus rogercresseyi]